MNSTIIVALITSIPAIISAIIALATFISTKKSNKLKEELEPIMKELQEVKRDTTRLQLLELIRNDPKNKDTILLVAEHYFCDLSANWFMASEVTKWAKSYDIEIPPHIWASIQANEHHNKK